MPHELLERFDQLQLQREGDVLIRHVQPDVDRGFVQKIGINCPEIWIGHGFKDPLVQACREFVIKFDDGPCVAVFNRLQGVRLVVVVDRAGYGRIEKTQVAAREVLGSIL